MTIEERIRDAFGNTDSFEPSRDLFAKVQRSIEEDRLHRRRVRAMALGLAGFVAIAAAWFAVWWDPQPGKSPLPWWSIVAVVVVVEIAIVVLLGPAIRRFGTAFADDVFRTSRGTGGRFLALLDVAYYLVFAGFVLLSIPIDPEAAWSLSGGVASVLQEEATRMGLLLLLMGMLHAVTIFVLPFAGLVFAATRHRAFVRVDKSEWPRDVRTAHRTVMIVAIVIGVFIAFQVVGLLARLMGLAVDLGG